ncbi:nicotinamide riboside transporter PnuC [Lewinella sp. 4G2]|uniref:nicotinamide riboside transporter PnuC n=1 Tax=Lewinella sp. 4G2 TaxID=1803372 RepID=UPI0007B4B7FE|nr:nicotinamide riboside transporter PnuC [Lewinella sp. 4G2]OAV43295.1 hypothetical protein A3850_001745 [Lewinella sp. 4G2]
MSELLTQLAAAQPLDWLAILTSIAYVVLAARGNNWCWLFAAVSTSVWGYQSLVVYDLVSDALLQGFYLVMAGVGVWQWQFGSRSGTALPVSRMTLGQHLFYLSLAGTCGSALGYFFSNTLQAAATYPDALTTAFSVGATFLLVRRKLENWLYWIVIDAVYVWIYLGQGAQLFALMMVINIGVAAYGWVNWRRELLAANTVPTQRLE